MITVCSASIYPFPAQLHYMHPAWLRLQLSQLLLFYWDPSICHCQGIKKAPPSLCSISPLSPFTSALNTNFQSMLIVSQLFSSSSCTLPHLSFDHQQAPFINSWFSFCQTNSKMELQFQMIHTFSILPFNFCIGEVKVSLRNEEGKTLVTIDYRI